MSSISGVSGSNYSSYSSYGKLASGTKLQTAADGAAELAIAEKENVQTTGYQVGSDNMKSGEELLNVSDSALSSINDSLQRIRELALQASNTATMSDSDRASLQDEVDQLKQGISDIASQTTYNTKQLLDGTNTDFSMATDANGSDRTVTTANATLEALGIEDFDVTGDFDIEDIDNAIAKVSEARSSIGAQTNGIDYAINYNSNAAYNSTAASSRLEDLDYPQAVSEQKKNQTLQAYALMMQKKKEEQEQNSINNLF